MIASWASSKESTIPDFTNSFAKFRKYLDPSFVIPILPWNVFEASTTSLNDSFNEFAASIAISSAFVDIETANPVANALNSLVALLKPSSALLPCLPASSSESPALSTLSSTLEASLFNSDSALVTPSNRVSVFFAERLNSSNLVCACATWVDDSPNSWAILLIACFCDSMACSVNSACFVSPRCFASSSPALSPASLNALISSFIAFSLSLIAEAYLSTPVLARM